MRQMTKSSVRGEVILLRKCGHSLCSKAQRWRHGACHQEQKNGDSSKNERFVKVYKKSCVYFFSNEQGRGKEYTHIFLCGEKSPRIVIFCCKCIFCLYLLSYFMETIENSFDFVCFQEGGKFIIFYRNPKVFRFNFVALFLTQGQLDSQGKSISQQIFSVITICQCFKQIYMNFI